MSAAAAAVIGVDDDMNIDERKKQRNPVVWLRDQDSDPDKDLVVVLLTSKGTVGG